MPSTLGKVLAGKQVERVDDRSARTTESDRARRRRRSDLETMFQLVYLRDDGAAQGRASSSRCGRRTSPSSSRTRRASPEFQFNKQSTGRAVQEQPASHAARSRPTSRRSTRTRRSRSTRIGSATSRDFTFVIVGDGRSREAEAAGRDLPREPAEQGPQGEGEGPRHPQGRAASSRSSSKLGSRAEGVGASSTSTATRRGRATRSATCTCSARCSSIRLREDLREDKGGVYGVGASGSIARSPHQERSVLDLVRLRAGARRRADQGGERRDRERSRRTASTTTTSTR